MIRSSLLLSFILVTVSADGEPPCHEGLRLNQIQVIGTHNSYHLKPPEPLFSQVKAAYPDAKNWDYSHLPLDEQLTHGVRSFELDLYNAPEGFQVFHVPMYDQESTCPRFRDCLQTVRDWSKNHPGHVPITFLLEIKEEEAKYSKTPILEIDAAAFDRLDDDIRSVFSPETLLTPDDIRGSSETLEEAVLDKGWPLLEECRGRVLFILHEDGSNRDLYTQGHDSLRGRAMFVRSEPGRPDAAVLVMDNPEDPNLPERVREGYLIRTRADTRLEQAANGEVDRRDRAIASGAHIISTDFPPGEAHPQSGYSVLFGENGTIRANPVNSNKDCLIRDIQ